MRYVVMYLNQYCWPEVRAICPDLEKAEELIGMLIESDGRKLVRRSSDEPEVTEDGVTPIPQIQFWTGPESYHSYIVQAIA